MTKPFAAVVPTSALARMLAGGLGRGPTSGAAGGEGFGQTSGPPDLGPAPDVWHQPGGEWTTKILHPALQLADREFRVLPEEGWFDPSVSFDRPIIVPLGALNVPENLVLFMNDYRFFVMRPSGLDPSDFLEAAAGRFSGVMGFDIQINGQRFGDLLYQLDPVPQQLTSQAFEPPIAANPPAESARAVPAQFNRATANSFASAAGVGTSLLPLQSNVQGPRNQPFTFIAGPASVVSLKAVIFRPITSPISAVAGKVSGHYLAQNTALAIINRIRPR